jgi:hypothetical protein
VSPYVHRHDGLAALGASHGPSGRSNPRRRFAECGQLIAIWAIR